MTKQETLRSAIRWEARVKAATVRLPEMGGRGVLIPGGLILTATHCIGWDGTAGLVLGDHHPVRVEAGDHSFRLGPWFADAVSDMAALGPLDNQVFPEDEDAFDTWRAGIRPVQLSPWLPKTRRLTRSARPESRPVWLLSLDGRWIRGKVVKYGVHVTPCAAIEPRKRIESGMSGGPVVDGRGRLIGVVSWGEEQGALPLATLALPSWILKRGLKAGE